jgi:hypothetical protein
MLTVGSQVTDHEEVEMMFENYLMQVCLPIHNHNTHTSHTPPVVHAYTDMTRPALSLYTQLHSQQQCTAYSSLHMNTMSCHTLVCIVQYLICQ